MTNAAKAKKTRAARDKFREGLLTRPYTVEVRKAGLDEHCTHHEILTMVDDTRGDMLGVCQKCGQERYYEHRPYVAARASSES